MSTPGKWKRRPIGFFIGGVVALLCAVAACESGGDATTTDGDSGIGITQQEDGYTRSDDAGIVILDTGLSYDAKWDDSSAQMIYDSGMPTCGYPVTCPQTRGLGTISGDTSPANNTVTTTGSTSEWISVRVTENDNSPIGRALSVTAKLTASPGTSYSLYLYVNDGSAKAECTKVAASSTDPGSVNTASTSWGEGAVANGKIDDATVTIRIQHVSGQCDSIDPWKLEVTGNTK